MKEKNSDIERQYPCFFLSLRREGNLTIYGLVKYAAAFYQTILVLTGANSKEELIFFKYLSREIRFANISQGLNIGYRKIAYIDLV
jgi:hypothetical protein